MNIIVAADKNWGIGRNNELLVSIPADMKMFRQETTGKVVVMGRKTLESFPNGLPLKNRTNIVITGNRDYQVKGAVVVHSIEEALKEVEKYPAEDVYWLLKKAHSLGKLTILNPAPAPESLPEDVLPFIDYLTPNETELAKLTGLPTETLEEIQTAAQVLRRLLSP